MKGLLRNNFYAASISRRIFGEIVVLVLLLAVLTAGRPTFLICCMLASMAGFPLNAMAGLRREAGSKWWKYKLTVPVRRSDLVKSYFAIQIFWLLVGGLLAGLESGLVLLLYGFPFDRGTDLFMIFVLGMGISLFAAAIFFPLFFLSSEARSELCLLAGLAGAAGLSMGITRLINVGFGPAMTSLQVIFGGFLLLACAALLFALSCPLTIAIFEKKEY